MNEKINILVIDDEPIVADALMIVLSDSGYEVVIAMTGRDGLEKINRQRFDVTITDLCLPDMSGLEVLSSIRDKDPGSLIIVITALCSPDIVAQSVSRGAIDVLSKPFFPSDVLGLLAKALTNRDSVH
ncbi:MAG TPA: response regulator [Blastocatellia bacterium]|jgi:DNA-binding NtrC family response regulator